MRRAYSLCVGVMLTGVLSDPVQAQSIRVQSAQIQAKRVKPGQAYSLEKTAGTPLRVLNTGSKTMELQVEVTIPKATELRPGYEPIADAGWIKPAKSRFVLSAAQEAASDAVISLPMDGALSGRRFQAQVNWRSTGRNGPGMTLKSRLLIDVSSEPLSLEEARKKFAPKSGEEPELNLFPSEGKARDIPVGRAVDLGKERKTSIKMVNPGSSKIHVHLRSIPVWESGLKVPEPFQETPDAGFLKTDTPLFFEMEPDSVKTVNMTVEFPDSEKYRRGSYMFVVCAEILERRNAGCIHYQLCLGTQ